MTNVDVDTDPVVVTAVGADGREQHHATRFVVDASGRETFQTVAYFNEIAHGYEALYEDGTSTQYAFSVRRQRVLEVFDAPGGGVLMGEGQRGVGALLAEKSARNDRAER